MVAEISGDTGEMYGDKGRWPERRRWWPRYREIRVRRSEIQGAGLREGGGGRDIGRGNIGRYRKMA